MTAPVAAPYLLMQVDATNAGRRLASAFKKGNRKLVAYRILDPTAAPLLAKEPVDVTTQIAKRAYQLYERRGRREGSSVLDWLQAEREISKNESPK